MAFIPWRLLYLDLVLFLFPSLPLPYFTSARWSYFWAYLHSHPRIPSPSNLPCRIERWASTWSRTYPLHRSHRRRRPSRRPRPKILPTSFRRSVRCVDTEDTFFLIIFVSSSSSCVYTRDNVCHFIFPSHPLPSPIESKPENNEEEVKVSDVETGERKYIYI